MIPIIYVIILMIFFLFALAVFIKSYVVGTISGMLFMVLGIYINANGILGLNNFLTQSFVIVLLALGFYITIQGSLELIETSGI